MCEWKAHSSAASRVTPAMRAVFSPTVSAMSNGGALGVGGLAGDIHSCGSCADAGTDFWPSTIELRLSVPPATTTRSMPALIEPAAICTADRPAAQWRLSARPGIESSPRSTAT